MKSRENQLFRTRWAAIGAAVAITMGAGGIGISHGLTSEGERSIYQAIEPCRIMDTRPTEQVGPRGTPLGADEEYTVDGWGDVGDCDLAEDTSALELNVTAVNATVGTFLTLFPAGTNRPTASNLNPAPGQPPNPNSVTVKVSDSGQFTIYNLAGTVDVIIDVVGVFDDHNHDDRYFTKSELDVAVAGVGSNGLGDSLCGDDPEVITINAAGEPVDAAFHYHFITHSTGIINADGSIFLVPDPPTAGLAKVTSVDHPAPGIYCLNFTGGTPPGDYLVSIMEIGLYEPDLD